LNGGVVVVVTPGFSSFFHWFFVVAHCFSLFFIVFSLVFHWFFIVFSLVFRCCSFFFFVFQSFVHCSSLFFIVFHWFFVVVHCFSLFFIVFSLVFRCCSLFFLVFHCFFIGLYVWDDLTYSDILGQNETTWLYFEVDSLGYYSVLFNSGGFECDIFDKCNPDNMEFGDTLLKSFISVEQQILDIGPVNPGDYFLSMHNTRNRAEFNFTIIVSDIVPGCTDSDAENYDVDANYDIGTCVYPLIQGCIDELACNYNPSSSSANGL
jgi:hypothetical protein